MRYRSTILLAVLFAAAAVMTAAAQAPAALQIAPLAIPSNGALDQQATPPPPPPLPPKQPAALKVTKPAESLAPAAPERLRRPSQLLNVKVELIITDQVGAKPPEKKSIVMVVADGERGSIRSTAAFVKEMDGTKRGFDLPLSADAAPEIEGNKIRLRLSLVYDLLGDSGAGSEGQVSIRESLSVIAENGVPLIVALSADPMSDRKVTVEVKATVLK